MTDRWGLAVEAVTRRRQLFKLSQRRCSILAGVSPTTWSKMESGEYVEPLTQSAAAQALGWPADFFDRVMSGDDPADLPSVVPVAARSTEERLAATEGQIAELLEIVEGIRADLASGRGGGS